MSTIRVTDDVPFVTRAAEVGQAHRDFLEITQLVESLELTEINKGRARLFISGTSGVYIVYPIECRIKTYRKRDPAPSQGIPIPVRDLVTEFDNGVRISRESFINTQVTLYYQAPQHISKLFLERKA